MIESQNTTFAATPSLDELADRAIAVILDVYPDWRPEMSHLAPGRPNQN
ncbi:MAG: hypothetical protein WCC64_15350 [Aliidongia sp.]